MPKENVSRENKPKKLTTIDGKELYLDPEGCIALRYGELFIPDNRARWRFVTYVKTHKTGDGLMINFPDEFEEGYRALFARTDNERYFSPDVTGRELFELITKGEHYITRPLKTIEDVDEIEMPELTDEAIADIVETESDSTQNSSRNEANPPIQPESDV